MTLILISELDEEEEKRVRQWDAGRRTERTSDRAAGGRLCFGRREETLPRSVRSRPFPKRGWKGESTRSREEWRDGGRALKYPDCNHNKPPYELPSNNLLGVLGYKPNLVLNATREAP